MAVIGSISTDFLAPGISHNGRLYTAELIEKAVARLQARLADPSALPVTMLSHHAAGDDSKELCARVMTAELGANHLATMHGYLIDTAAGKDIAAAVEPGPDGRRVLDSVSIRGWWLGPVRTVDIDGRTVETGDDLEIDGIDFTKSPGVDAARIRSASRLTSETDARTPITESVEVTVMSDAVLVHSTSTPTPADIPPLRPSLVDKDAIAAEIAAESARKTAEESDSSPMAGDGDAPSGATETAPHPLAEMLTKLREAHVAIGGWQGPVDIDLDAWGLSNDDVAAAATQLGLAYTAALRVLDPDNDDDLDLPDGDDVPECPMCGAAVPAGASYCPACGAAMADPAVADSTEKESTVTETKPAEETTDKATPPAEESAPAAATTTTTEDAAAGDPAAPPAPPALSLTPGDIEAISTSLHAKLAAAAPPAPAESAAPTDATIVAEAVKAATEAATAAVSETLRAELRKEMLETYGAPRRKGLVEAATTAAAAKPLHDMSPEEFTRHAASAWDGVLGTPAG